MEKLFSERYKELIADTSFIDELSRELKFKLIDFLYEFNEPSKRPVSRLHP